MEKEMPIYSHNPYDATKFPLLVLDVERQMCRPANEGFRVFHWHEEIQFVYILRGTVRFKIYDKEIDLKVGDCMFINQSALHQIMEKEDCHYHSYIVPIRMLSFFSGSIMEERDVMTVVKNPALTHFAMRKEDKQCHNVMEAFRVLDQIYFCQTSQKHPEYQISIQLAKIWLELISILPESPKDIPAVSHERIRRLISFVHQNYDKDISLKDIAGAASISPTECQRCFRSYVQCSPYQYLMEYRLEQSKSMLVSSNRTVTEIAVNVGFNSVSAYIKYFKRAYGITPARFRNL